MLVLDEFQISNQARQNFPYSAGNVNQQKYSKHFILFHWKYSLNKMNITSAGMFVNM